MYRRFHKWLFHLPNFPVSAYNLLYLVLVSFHSFPVLSLICNVISFIASIEKEYPFPKMLCILLAGKFPKLSDFPFTISNTEQSDFSEVLREIFQIFSFHFVIRINFGNVKYEQKKAPQIAILQLCHTNKMRAFYSHILLFFFTVAYQILQRRINTYGMYVDKNYHFDYTKYIPNEWITVGGGFLWQEINIPK